MNAPSLKKPKTTETAADEEQMTHKIPALPPGIKIVAPSTTAKVCASETTQPTVLSTTKSVHAASKTQSEQQTPPLQLWCTNCAKNTAVIEKTSKSEKNFGRKYWACISNCGYGGFICFVDQTPSQSVAPLQPTGPTMPDSDETTKPQARHIVTNRNLVTGVASKQPPLVPLCTVPDMIAVTNKDEQLQVADYRSTTQPFVLQDVVDQFCATMQKQPWRPPSLNQITCKIVAEDYVFQPASPHDRAFHGYDVKMIGGKYKSDHATFLIVPNAMAEPHPPKGDGFSCPNNERLYGFWLPIQAGFHPQHVYNPITEGEANYIVIQQVCDDKVSSHWLLFRRETLAEYIEKYAQWSRPIQKTQNPLEVSWSKVLAIADMDLWLFAWIPMTAELEKEIMFYI